VVLRVRHTEASLCQAAGDAREEGDQPLGHRWVHQDHVPQRRAGQAGRHRHLNDGDSQAQDPAAELQKVGGARAILATATSGEARSAVQGGLTAGNMPGLDAIRIRDR
jgi:hypothetical protein